MKRLICIFFLVLIGFFSCQKTEADGTLNETIYVINYGADMPAYVHGNPKDKIFIVALHGAGSFGLSFRTEAFRELEEFFTILYFDQRGQSMSQGHYKKPEAVLAQMAQDVSELTAVLKAKYGEDIKLYLLGHSLGGLIGTKALITHNLQNIYSGWINVDGLMDAQNASLYRGIYQYAVAEEQIQAGNSVEEWQKIKDELDTVTDVFGADYDRILELSGQCSQLLTKDKVVAPELTGEVLNLTVIKNNPIHWLVSNFFNQPVNEAVNNSFELSYELGQLRIPTLFIYGKYDFSVPPIAGQIAFQKVKSADKQLAIPEASMHHPFYTEPVIFADLVENFIWQR